MNLTHLLVLLVAGILLIGGAIAVIQGALIPGAVAIVLGVIVLAVGRGGVSV